MFNFIVPRVTSKKLDTFPDFVLIIKNGRILKLDLDPNCNRKKLKNLLYEILNELKKLNS